MKAGALDRKIDIQRQSATQSPSGATSEIWATIAGGAARPASVRPLRGEERFTEPQWIARQQVEVEIRWTAALAALSPRNRLIYPAVQDWLSPPDAISEERIYDIMDVQEIDRRAGLRIFAARRADGAQA